MCKAYKNNTYKDQTIHTSTSRWLETFFTYSYIYIQGNNSLYNFISSKDRSQVNK